jgi:ferric-dicitrate binding protein FerR (iron transport regulator)
MNDDRRHDDNLPPGEDGALALKALVRLPGAKAPEAARAQARAAFLWGGDSAPAEVRTIEPRRSSRRRWLGLMMAAVLGVLAVVWFGSLPTEEWVVLDVVKPDGVVVSQGALDVGTRLSGGRVATGPESELEVQLGDQVRFRMTPGTELQLPRPPGRWFSRGRRLDLNAGEIYGTSGGHKLDFELVFATGELEAQLTGTTFAVFRTDEASCVCLWEGGISVMPLVGDETPITLAEKQRVWIFKDGRAPEILPLSDMETMKLQMIHDAGLATP